MDAEASAQPITDVPFGDDPADVITYAGVVSMAGYHKLCDALKGKSAKRVLLVLATPGGDPHAGFRIARALQHGYEKFELLVPRYCKSAGTLIAIGAEKLYLSDMSELGPLDVQVKKNDELLERNSGLDIFAAVDYLREQSVISFTGACTRLVRDMGLSTRVASKIATHLTTSMLEPIAAQIDPMKLAAMQRAMNIAYQYGQRLNAKSANLQPMGLNSLVAGYPSHGFVIDRKEARDIFVHIERPHKFLQSVADDLHAKMEPHISESMPDVHLTTYQPDTKGADDAKHEDPGSHCCGTDTAANQHA